MLAATLALLSGGFQLAVAFRVDLPLTLAGRNWQISSALVGEWVQVVKLEERLQVYYCSTLVREIDLAIQRSTMVERWIPLPNQ